MKKKAKGFFRLFIAVTAVLIAAEFVARFIVGLGAHPIFEASADYGYRFVPNQDIRCYGNRIFFNAQGLRSEPIALKPADGTIRIVCIGDSITYGGALTDQKDTYPYQLQDILNRKGSARFEVLNASAPSWSIRDEESYIRKHGLYNSHIVFFQTSEHDLFQARCSGEVVGNSPDFPDKRPVFALQDFALKCISRVQPFGRFGGISQEEIPLPEKQLESNLRSLTRLAKQVRGMDSEFIVVFIGTRLESGRKRPSIEGAKARLFNTLKEEHIDFIKLDEEFSSKEGDNLLRDTIHPNPAGNRVIAHAAAEFILYRVGSVAPQ